MRIVVQASWRTRWRAGRGRCLDRQLRPQMEAVPGDGSSKALLELTDCEDRCSCCRRADIQWPGWRHHRINRKTAYAHRSSVYATLRLGSDHALRVLAAAEGW